MCRAVHPVLDHLPDIGAAHDHVAAGALVGAPPGPVGLELEAHVVDLDAPGVRVGWERLTAVVADLPPLPGRSRVTLEPGGQLELPVTMVATEDGLEPVGGRTSFAAWVAGRVLLGDRRPTVADLDRHLTTLFPPVRLRGLLEIQYLDAAPEPWWPALAAVLTTLLDDPVAADVAAAAEPVAGAWDRAARDGLTDPALATAARTCLSAALDRAPAAVRPEVTALAELVDRGGCPGDALAAAARTHGPSAALLTATSAREAPR